MSRTVYARWRTLIALLQVEVAEAAEPPYVLRERIQDLIRRCPFDTIEADLWTLHDHLALRHADDEA
jgi:hypothetical protein